MNLRDFLIESKKKTFASRFSLPKSLSDGSKRYEFSKGSFWYVDEFKGSVVDEGQERVYCGYDLIWQMNYSGGMKDGFEDLSRGCFSFLKECLRDLPKEFPIRGPREKKKENWRYVNDWKGNLDSFEGFETIFRGNDKVYSRVYSGGLINRE